MTKEYYIDSFRVLFHKDILLKVAIFLGGYVLILSQNWVSLSLILCPVISFGFALFFQIISNNKKITELKKSSIVFSPIGEERTNSNILVICSYLNLALVFIMGLDSFVHPQLIDNYFLLFLTVIVFIYGFGFFFLIIRVLSTGKVLMTPNEKSDLINKDPLNNPERVISFVKVGAFKKISIINLAIFASTLALTLSLSYLTFDDILPGLSFYHPGTGLEASQPVSISIMLYIDIMVSPIVSCWLLYSTYHKVATISDASVERTTKDLSKDLKKKIEHDLSIYRD